LSRLALLTFLGVLLLVAVAEAQDELFVPGGVGRDANDVFGRTASGNTAPLRTLQGPATHLCTPGGVVLDRVHHELFVMNYDCQSISVYDLSASGDTAPLRTLEGPAAALPSGGLSGISLDLLHDELFVLDTNTDSVSVFSRTASGNTAPLRKLQGPATGLNLPFGHPVLDLTSNELFVADSSSIAVFSRTASGNTPPLRTIHVQSVTGLTPLSLALDPLHNELFAVTLSSVLVYGRTASGDATPLRTLSGLATGLSGDMNVAVDLVNDELFVTTGNFLSSPKSAVVHRRTASGNAAPLRTLVGPATLLELPMDIALTPRFAALATVNSQTFATGSTMFQTAGLSNPGLGAAMDLYIGNLRPNGVIEFLTGAGVTLGSLGNLGSFQPLLTGLPLNAPFSVVVPNFLTHTWTALELQGDYLFFVLALTTGALSDGIVTGDELLGVAGAPYRFSTGTP
jgi:hypothetical protein